MPHGTDRMLCSLAAPGRSQPALNRLTHTTASPPLNSRTHCIVRSPGWPQPRQAPHTHCTRRSMDGEGGPSLALGRRSPHSGQHKKQRELPKPPRKPCGVCAALAVPGACPFRAHPKANGPLGYWCSLTAVTSARRERACACRRPRARVPLASRACGAWAQGGSCSWQASRWGSRPACA